MSRWLTIIMVGLLGLAAIPNRPGLQLAAAQAEPASAPLDSVTPPTQITAKTMEYDMKAQKARLEGDVVVIDGDMKLTADLVIVTFDANNQAKEIEATGNVVIVRGEGTATAGKAHFDVLANRVVLSDNPVLKEPGHKIRNAEQVILDRREGKFFTNGGRPIIEFTKAAAAGGSSMMDTLIGAPAKDNAPANP